MPRIDRNRSLPFPYRPAPPPIDTSTRQEILRAIWSEFNRIASTLSDLDNPISLAVSNVDSITVGATATYQTMLNASPTVAWEAPGGTFDGTTGLWTCPSEGLYQVFISVVSDPFAAPATKSYSVNVRLTETPVTGAPVVRTFAGGGLDDQFVTATSSFLLPLQQGETLKLEAAGIHATKTGTNVVNARMTVQRISGIGNAN